MSDQDQPGQAVTPAATPTSGRGSLRVSHEDRDEVAEALRVAAGDGRLTADELDERLERALTARTYDDLSGLLTDLPATGTALVPASGLPAGVPPGPAKDLMKIDVTSGNSDRVGRWTVPARMDLRVRSGGVKLDFTEAVITQPTLHIDAEVRSGNVTLLIVPGIAVEMHDVSVRSGNVKISEPWGPNVPPFLRITVAGTCGSGNITARPRRRSLRQWLARAPKPWEIAMAGNGRALAR
jgi:hypothetical protein